MKKELVVVAMSGGVDSSVAAALLKDQGFEVIGMTMCFNFADGIGKRPSCCGLQGIEDARRVAHALGIKHYVVNMQYAMNEHVINDFCQEYISGRTPNPCVRCNQFLKFEALLKRALALGAAHLATGHYARVITMPGPGLPAPSYVLKKAKDPGKDQSYFLYRLGQPQLRYVIFPLGELTKVRVRELARRYRLPVAQKPDSQEICFLPDNNYRSFLLRWSARMKKRPDSCLAPGPIVDKEGRILGTHKGTAFYTIGQREGLGIALGYPAYVIKIEPKVNQIVVGKRIDAYASSCIVRQPHFVRGVPFKKNVALGVRIRYNHKEAAAVIGPAGQSLRVEFRLPQFAITPGQSAVFYDKDTVVGGGIIERAVYSNDKEIS